MQIHTPSSRLPLPLPRPFLRFLSQPPKPSPFSSCSSPIRSPNPRISCKFSNNNNKIKIQSKKDNVWSIDNDLAAKKMAIDKKKKRKDFSVRGMRKKGKVDGRKKSNELVLASAAMLMEVEIVLQTQEPVIKPAWSTFSSSVTGMWKGVGAVFSPFNAQMEPIGVGNKNENLYDCYTLSRIERSPSDEIIRKTYWVTLNPFGEKWQRMQGSYKDSDSESKTHDVNPDFSLPSFESFDFGKSEVLEEDSMSMEPGLVFFEDGSYSRGPVEIPVGESDESKPLLSPTFKFEQCLVKGCHKRLRIVHTIEFSEGGAEIQIIRVAVYEEQWVSPVKLYEGLENKADPKPISLRRRTQPSELAGSWKVFEVSATPIFNDESTIVEEGSGPPYVYLCTETLKKRSLPESCTYFVEEEMLDTNEVTVLWLPGGVTGYVDVKEDGVLCIGVGWYSEEGVNLVMERDYGVDGKLEEVRSKTEVKRRWTEPVSP